MRAPRTPRSSSGPGSVPRSGYRVILIGRDTVAIAGSLGAEHVQRRLAQIPEGRRFPVVVFLHGCTGIGIPEHKASQLLDDAGYAVIMPNSFSRQAAS